MNQYETTDAIIAYLTSNFLNYNRGLLQKTVQKKFGCGYDQLVNKVIDELMGVVTSVDNCATDSE
ncbi:hypothetical protein [Pseudobutyrivibrio xylanivorans]|nr:hypothetical protein [Pseudobutyrivibrio xylanivorans]